MGIFLNGGAGVFGAEATYAVGGFMSSLATGAFTAKGALDLVVAGESGAFTVGSPTTVGGGATTCVAVGDLNSDGLADLVVTGAGGALVVLLNKGSGAFAAPVTYTVGVGSPPLAAVAMGDFNGDGWLDLVVVDRVADSVSVLLNQGAGAFGAPVTFAVGSSPIAIAVADFNGDHKPDLAVANEADNTIDILLNDCAP